MRSPRTASSSGAPSPTSCRQSDGPLAVWAAGSSVTARTAPSSRSKAPASSLALGVKRSPAGAEMCQSAWVARVCIRVEIGARKGLTSCRPMEAAPRCSSSTMTRVSCVRLSVCSARAASWSRPLPLQRRFSSGFQYEGVACGVLDMRMLNLSGLDVRRAIAGKAPRCRPCSSAARAMSLPQRQRCETARSISW